MTNDILMLKGFFFRFRFDSAKHMWPEDIAAIQSHVNNLNEEWFVANSTPFFYHEVIDRDDEAIKAEDYFHLGMVTEFRYSQKIAWGTNGSWYQLENLFVEGWI